MTIMSSNVHYVRNNIAWIAESFFIRDKLAKSIRLQIRGIKMMWNSKSLLKVINSRCAQNASSGLKRIKDAIIWRADVDMNFAMFAEENIYNANVLKNKNNNNRNS